MATSTYSATLHHLAPGASAAGLDFPEEQLPVVNAVQLQELLYALGEVASRLTIYEPSTPEIRIKTDRDVFVVRTRHRRLCFVGWESILRGEDHSVAFIMATVTGTTAPLKAPPPKVERTFVAPNRPPTRAQQVEAGRFPRWAKITIMAVLIIGFNATTAWLLLRPPPTHVPQHDLLPEFESRALLTKVAGEYDTGLQEGNRHLLVDSDGTLHLAKLGKDRALTEERTRVARGAIVDGRAALITNDPAILVIKDADTVVLYGTTYRRRVR